ncbi:MAG: mandelate racemase/muconate lactonizing enzyme family protein [Dehalococcoidia bacterium]|nr:mandelate racemase/muconate lactonizing enzyme family protein [Dehalococcoidia bacterium]
MKIVDARTRAVAVPLERPFLAGGLHMIERIPFALLELRTDEGITGLGYAFSLSERPFGSIVAATDALSQEAVGENPLEPERVAAKLGRAFGWAGPVGVVNMAMAAVDFALWDIAGKAYGQPLYRLLGGHRDRVPCYYSGALWRDFGLEELEGAARAVLDLGFRSMKMRMGSEPPRGEEERARVVREAIGPEADLLVDINQGWTPYHAIRMGRMLERYEFGWLEDPVDHRDVAGSARVAAALDMPVCAGEYHYGKEPFLRLLNAQAMDIAMVDLLRVGGVTEWRKAAALAETFTVPVASHLLPEIAVHLVAAVPNGLTVEYMPWSLPLFLETPRVQDGMMVLPHAPGLGLELDEEKVARWSI